ncbi:hypothetical protein CCC_03718 [Paramagnetospirillum magnetotacticum MS-1]|uniref:Uncharacterized protein n=1 Tax=Paramagnetospirillum magnetotacticum MS-1 TaxID=272627 RepID=A0A0C2YUQ9_PARME|nr:hypothetical protein [Paramagnetospirillum magnetotacticum]KIL98435.1 hypothetical protein CCC_03718 [Paramagnetospirillum magnetotacticum MS-1]
MVKDETRIVGNLPNLRMEIVHRQDPDGGAEHMSIHLSATPSFQAAEALLSGAWSNPWTLWSSMTQAMLAPWAGAPWLKVLPPGNSK